MGPRDISAPNRERPYPTLFNRGGERAPETDEKSPWWEIENTALPIRDMARASVDNAEQQESATTRADTINKASESHPNSRNVPSQTTNATQIHGPRNQSLSGYIPMLSVETQEMDTSLNFGNAVPETQRRITQGVYIRPTSASLFYSVFVFDRQSPASFLQFMREVG